MTTAIRIAQGMFGRVALLDMDAPLVSHAHSQCHVVLKASGADSAFYVSEERLPVTDRTAILVNAWEPHYFYSDPNFPRTLYLVLYIEPKWLATLHDPLRMSGHPGFFPCPCVEITPHVRKLADGLIAELLSLIPMAQERLESALFELMLAISEQYSALKSMDDLVRPQSLQLPDSRVQRAIGYIRDNLGHSLDMDRVAASAHLSRAQFFVRFRRATGMTPQVFVNTLRAETACRRLAEQETRTSLGMLAEELGFSDQGHFTRFIRGHLGVTPSEYRRVVQVYGQA